MKGLLPNPYLLGIGVALLAYILIYGLRKLLSIRIGQYVGVTRNRWDDFFVHVVEHTSQFFMISSSLYIAYQYMPHRKWMNAYVNKGYFIIVMFQVGIWLNYLLDRWINSALNKKTRNNRAAASSISLVKLLSKMGLFSLIFLFTLNNLDIKVTTIVAGLGVGGIAVALAIQKILGDLFSSLSIVLDKPFVVGDFIIMNEYLGEVEKIGLRTTRIRSLGGEQVTISNSDILASRIRNMTRMQERRVSFVLHLPLQSSEEDLDAAIDLITGIIKRKERVRFDRCHLRTILHSFEIETVYFFLHDDYNLHMDLQQEVLREILRSFRVHGLRFAYPTQTLHHMPTEVFMRGDWQPQAEQNKARNSLS